MSVNMTIDTEGRFPVFNWEVAAGAWAKKVAPLGQGMLRAHAPFRTGAFRASISERTTVEPGVATVMFYSQSPYAKWIVSGTDPHPIVARNARALRWLANSGHGPVQFARAVQHPGTKPNEFAETAMAAISPAVAAMFADAVRESLEL